MKEVMFWGIDPSIKNTGVVCLNSEGKVLIALDAGNKKKSIFPFVEYAKQATKIADLFNPDNINYIVYEDYSYNSTHKEYSLSEFGGVLKYFIGTTKPASFIYAAPKQVKVFATGSGMASKEIVALHIKSMLDFPKCVSFDITDAGALALLCFFKYQPDIAAKNFRHCDPELLRKRLSIAQHLKREEIF